MTPRNVLFVCVHNSARSQMAETFLNQMCPDEFRVSSAGLEPSRINPLVVEVMQEVGIDLSSKATGICQRQAWSFEDPSSFVGSHEEKLTRTRLVRDQIRDAVARFCDQHCAARPRPRGM